MVMLTVFPTFWLTYTAHCFYPLTYCTSCAHCLPPTDPLALLTTTHWPTCCAHCVPPTNLIALFTDLLVLPSVYPLLPSFISLFSAFSPTWFAHCCKSKTETTEKFSFGAHSKLLLVTHLGKFRETFPRLPPLIDLQSWVLASRVQEREKETWNKNSFCV
jgi:hypothetical protein